MLFAAAIVLRHVLAANTDVSWLLTVGERVLDGQRLYVDVLEINPPMAVLIYMPGIVIARALGLPVETVTDGLIFAAIFVSLAIVARILKPSSVLPGATSSRWLPLGFAVLAILPMQAFGQREHIAIVELLPLLAVFAVRMKGESPSAWTAVIAGCGAGLAVSFKPHFAIGILCAVGCLAIYLRSWKVVFALENLTAAVDRPALRGKRDRVFPGVLHRDGTSDPRYLCSRRVSRSRRFWKNRRCRSGALWFF